MIDASTGVIRQHFDVLVGELSPDIVEGFRERGLEVAAHFEMVSSVGGTIDHEAIAYTHHRAGELIKDFARTTPDMLRSSVERAFFERWSSAKLRDTLREDYAFSPVRALAIARTEMGMAMRAGSDVSARACGADEKSWSAAVDACPLCLENAAAGWIAIDNEFPEGQDPHVSCRCSTDYRTVATLTEAETIEDIGEEL